AMPARLLADARAPAHARAADVLGAGSRGHAEAARLAARPGRVRITGVRPLLFVRTMQSLWSDREARECCARYAGTHGEDVALRVYTSRLIGRDPSLVLHGGGNTSVKTTVNDLLGAPVEVLCVKGSGSDLADVEPEGLPAVELAPLLRLRELPALTDEQ